MGRRRSRLQLLEAVNPRPIWPWRHYRYRRHSHPKRQHRQRLHPNTRKGRRGPEENRGWVPCQGKVSPRAGPSCVGLCAIVVRDITGADLYNSGMYQHSGRKSIELTLHKGHPRGKNLQFPQARKVVFYEGDVWEAIREATQGEPKAVRVLAGGQDKRLTVDQFVLEDGRTYRTAQTHDALLKACPALVPEDPEALAQKVFGENHAASVVTKEHNNWKPTPFHLLEVAQGGCVEHGHGGLWNAPNYHINDVVSIDMHSCYPASFMGKGEAAPWFQRFGHPRHRMTRVAVNGPIPDNIGTSFTQVQAWQFAKGLHPVRLPLPGEEVDADGPARIYGRDWPPDQTRDRRGHRRLWEADRGLAPRLEGPGMLCHRQVHTGRQGRQQEAHPQAHHRPGRTGLPRPRHVPVRDPSRRPCKMSGWLDPHLLRRLPAAVRPPQGLDAGLRSY